MTPRRVWPRTVLIALAGAIVMGLAVDYAGSGPLWPIAPLLALLIVGVAGGVVARSWLDIFGLVVGGAMGIMANGVIWSMAPEAASDTLVHATVPATMIGTLLAGVGGITFVVARRVERGSARLFVGIGMAVLIAVAWLVVMGEESVATLESYQVLDAQTIEVVAASAPHAWTRITDVSETATEVRITVRWQTWMRGSGTAELNLVPLTVRLAQPLGERTVLGGDGQPVRRDEGP